ncbi:MAG: hypothetical protein ACOH2O_14305 [Pseudomonas sp.]
MTNRSESVYAQTLVAVFGAAFELGFDPYALALQAKLDVATDDKWEPLRRTESVQQVIDESLLAARVLHSR